MSATSCFFRELEHTADLAIEVWGEDFASLLAHAAEAVFALEGLPEAGGERVVHEVTVHAPDRETLLVDWLNELLFLSETLGEMYTAFTVRLTGDSALAATVEGHRGHPTKRRIKAATFYDLRVACDEGRCVARVVFDV
ncbi:MAG: archease [Anaerolineales bacterium]